MRWIRLIARNGSSANPPGRRGPGTVWLTAGATILRASESLVQKFVNRPQSITEEAVRDIERASFALLDYISRKLAGKPVPALAMFPQYEALAARLGNTHGATHRPLVARLADRVARIAASASG